MSKKSNRRQRRQFRQNQHRAGTIYMSGASRALEGRHLNNRTQVQPASPRLPFKAPRALLALLRDYPKPYRKVRGFENRLWARGPKTVLVRRPFLRGKSEQDGRWAAARQNGTVVVRFGDYMECIAWITVANRRLHKWFKLEWYHMLEVTESNG